MDCSSLRQIVIGGSMVDWDVVAAARQKLCNRIDILYGSTETGPTAIGPADRFFGKSGATGFVLPWASVEVLDEAGRPLAPGEEGALRLKSAACGRWAASGPGSADMLAPGARVVTGNSSADRTDLDLPWFYPGDRGSVGADGLLTISGRLDDLINLGGVKIAPETIESAARSYPMVVDAAAISVRLASGLDQIWLAIVESGPVDADALAAHCGTTVNKAVFRKGTFAGVVRVSAIPRTESGKIARKRLRELLDPRAIAGLQ